MQAPTDRAFLIHGTGGNPDNFWFPTIKTHLSELGFDVVAPQMPNPDQPDLAVWTNFFHEHYGALNEGDIIIGHSAGVPCALALIEQASAPINKALLVAGYATPLPHHGPDHPALFKNPNWSRIKNNAHSFYFIHSDNDPWGCDHKQGEIFREKLGGTLIIKTGEGHFGSAKFNQPYKDFPLLKYCISE